MLSQRAQHMVGGDENATESQPCCLTPRQVYEQRSWHGMREAGQFAQHA